MTASLASLHPAVLVLVMALMIVGGLVVLIGALGLLRLPNFYQRMHGPAVITTLGAGCLLFASLLRFQLAQGWSLPHELLVPVFIVMTAPVSAMLMTRVAFYRDLRAGRRDPRSSQAGDHPIPLEEDSRPAP